MKRLFLQTLFLIGVIFPTIAQVNTNTKKATASIYTVLNPPKNFYDFSTVNKNLRLEKLSFFIVDKNDIDNGLFSVPFNQIRKKPSALIYDDYQDYQYNNLLKGFFRKYDPTR